MVPTATSKLPMIEPSPVIMMSSAEPTNMLQIKTFHLGPHLWRAAIETYVMYGFEPYANRTVLKVPH